MQVLFYILYVLVLVAPRNKEPPSNCVLMSTACILIINIKAGHHQFNMFLADSCFVNFKSFMIKYVKQVLMIQTVMNTHYDFNFSSWYLC